MLEKIKNHIEVCKPRVVATMLFTALVGMFLASPNNLMWSHILLGIIGIGLIASAAAAINQVADYKIDVIMARTQRRPIPAGHLSKNYVLGFAAILALAGSSILLIWINLLTTILTLISMVGYALIYTHYLKYATPQNIVIGGAAGATPPLLGWTAMTNELAPGALLLFLIVFIWTPPHFWALALYRIDDYKNAGVPMLPITHGEELTRTHIVLYTLLLSLITLFPFIIGMSGWVYLASSILLNGIFIYHAVRLKITASRKWANHTFIYSIFYLLLLFAALLIDAYLPALSELIAALQL
ncbi:MAG: heme o synthase [Candidatus Oxydemutatoraceae bacterium WSBS_2016_MAG_OTU14]